MSQIGEAKKRVTGKLKVTGGARYAADFAVENMAYGVLTTSTIAKGRILRINSQAAEAVPGVIKVLTPFNAPPLLSSQSERKEASSGPSGKYPQMLYSERVYFYGQPIAVTVAETLEQAEQAAALLKVTYAPEDHAVQVEAAQTLEEPPEGGMHSGNVTRGNPTAALAEAAARVDASYLVPTEHHNPIEPHATLAVWDGLAGPAEEMRLTVYDKTQWVVNVQNQLGTLFDIPQENVSVISPFVGGGFGCAGRMWQQTSIAPIAAKAVNRPVKLVVSRQQMFTLTGHRPYTTQRVALGADTNGQLTAIVHAGTAEVSPYETYTENLLSASRFLYACPNVETQYRLARLNLSSPTYMRAPGEAQGVYALESALDELAYALEIDPLALRLTNYAEKDPESGLPWSEKGLRQCYESGAQRFGWGDRSPQPRSMTSGDRRVGYGMATATYPMWRMRATAKVRVLADGSAVVQCAASDMGPGTYTTMTLIAADTLGIPSDRVTFELGDSSFPFAPPHGGSMTVASVGSAVQAACQEARAKALSLVPPDSPLAGAKADAVDAAGGRLFLKQDSSQGLSYSEILAQSGQEAIEVEKTSEPGDERQKYSMHSFGAHFVEVQVDEVLGDINVTRVVSAIDVGRIMNPNTARSQVIGGVVGGIGMALHEHTHIDPRFGNYVNANLGEYLVPVNADIYDIEAIFCGEPDYNANPLGARGLGEIPLVGVAAAVANAVYHATGKRVRDLPITPDKIL
ncbi:MAG: xanthine dehydrogenase family protein molybdopterin-binding subunit [Elainellaceae cyanobacterium]